MVWCEFWQDHPSLAALDCTFGQPPWIGRTGHNQEHSRANKGYCRMARILWYPMQINSSSDNILFCKYLIVPDTNRLLGASEGNVVTRFPPEPSGYLHIGHIKAAMLNAFYATMYKGKLILRFDDTNPAKEKDDFVDNIKDDLHEIGINFQSVSFTSDYFDVIEKYAIQLIKAGRAFIDDTPMEQMRAERKAEGTGGVESKCRNQTIEENLKLFDEMRAGSATGLKCVMRAKIGIFNPIPIFLYFPCVMACIFFLKHAVAW